MISLSTKHCQSSTLLILLLIGACEAPFQRELLYVSPQTPASFSAPQGIVVTSGNQQAAVSWNPVAGAVSYNLYWSTSPGVTTASGTKIAGVTSPYTVSGLINGVAFYCVVTAMSAVAESPASARFNATPQGYTITYVGNGNSGGSPPLDPTAYGPNANASIQSASSLTSATGSPVSWNTSPSGSGTPYSPGASVSMNADLTLYAQYLTLAGSTLSSIPAGATDVVVPMGVTNLTPLNSPTLQSVTIQAGVTGISVQAFMGCPNLTSITITSNATYQVINGALVDTTANRLMCVPAKLAVNDFAIPAGITVIDPYAFGNCTGLTGSIIIPSSLSSISGNAFSGLASPISVTIPSTVTSIQAYAFYNANSITDVYLPATPIVSLGGGAGTEFSAGVLIHTPDGTSQAAYQATTNWSDFAGQIVTP